jgi:hypothetical protein
VIQVASGVNGLDEMKSTMEEDVFFGFLRETYYGKNFFAFIIYIPESVSGVRRGGLFSTINPVAEL